MSFAEASPTLPSSSPAPASGRRLASRPLPLGPVRPARAARRAPPGRLTRARAPRAQAYYAAAKRFHPDKAAAAGLSAEDAEARFRDLAEAYEARPRHPTQCCFRRLLAAAPDATRLLPASDTHCRTSGGPMRRGACWPAPDASCGMSGGPGCRRCCRSRRSARRTTAATTWRWGPARRASTPAASPGASPAGASPGAASPGVASALHSACDAGHIARAWAASSLPGDGVRAAVTALYGVFASVVRLCGGTSAACTCIPARVGRVASCAHVCTLL